MKRVAEVAPAPDSQVLEEAAGWLVRLESGPLGQAERQALEGWRARCPEHERAWQAALELKRLMGRVPPAVGAPVLGRQRLDRRTLLKSLVGLVLAAPAGWAAYRHAPWPEWIADHRTAAGERRELILADGSRVLLNTATALDFQVGSSGHLLVLHAGEVMITTARESSAAARAGFRVRTAQGEIQALGTRFVVRQGEGWTEVGVLEHAVRLRPRRGAAAPLIEAGGWTRFSAHDVQPERPLTEERTAWIRRQIVADGVRLGDLAAELGRYRPGLLRCDPEVAELRISGVFQTDDTDRAIGIIQETLPVRVSYLSSYWVSIGPRE